MTTYISILRGINVSGQKRIKMNVLKEMYENLGFQNVITYVQSGNVIFTGKNIETRQLEQKISRQVKTDFGFDVPVIVLAVDKLKQVITGNPFGSDRDKDPAFLHVTFLSSKPGHYDPETINNKKQDGEEIFFTDNAVYLYCPKGYGKTKLTNNFLENKLKVRATTRNWKTTNELLKLARQENSDQKNPT